MDTSVIEFLSQYDASIIFLGSVFFGESVIIAASYVAAQGVWGIPLVFIYAFLGTILSDSLWFWIGKKLSKWLHTKPSFQKKYQRYTPFIEKIGGKKPFLVLLFIKFLYGTRIITIVYLSIRRIPFSKFLLFNSIGTAIWLCVIIAIGWGVEKGLAYLLPVFSKIEYTILVIVLLIIAFRLFSVWTNKMLIKK